MDFQPESQIQTPMRILDAVFFTFSGLRNTDEQEIPNCATFIISIYFKILLKLFHIRNHSYTFFFVTFATFLVLEKVLSCDISCGRFFFFLVHLSLPRTSGSITFQIFPHGIRSVFTLLSLVFSFLFSTVTDIFHGKMSSVFPSRCFLRFVLFTTSNLFWTFFHTLSSYYYMKNSGWLMFGSSLTERTLFYLCIALLFTYTSCCAYVYVSKITPHIF